MKKLFKVVNTGDPQQKTLETFVNKQDAKVFRDGKNKDENYMRFRVCRGPDHWRGESFVKSKKSKVDTPKKVKEDRKSRRTAAKKAAG